MEDQRPVDSTAVPRVGVESLACSPFSPAGIHETLVGIEVWLAYPSQGNMAHKRTPLLERCLVVAAVE